MTNEQAFFRIIQDYSKGVEVKGKSAYIRLMQLKSRYYQETLPSIKDEINQLLPHIPEYREEIFQKLSNFFSHCFSPTGTLCCRYQPGQIFHHQINNREDVFLHWASHMFYYMKADRPYVNLEVKLNKVKFFFDTSALQSKRVNGQSGISYQFRGKKEDGTLVFAVLPIKQKNIIKTLIGQLQQKEVDVDKKTLKSAISLFESQGEQNYFIHKSPRLFLKEQFHLWLHQNLLESSKVWNKESIEKVQVLQKITYKLISLFSPFEEELIRIWNKPKFILKANYVITLDRIAQKDENLIRRLAAHPGIQSQIEEWRKLELVDGDFPITDLGLSAKNCILPIDTKYFKDLEPEILSLFDHLDEQLDGWLIKSENYQALNTILPKFKERVQVIYIDPPFNRQQEPGYSYSVKYKDASWITLLENRLQPARQMLRDTGCIFVRCDYNGNMFVRLLMDQIFGRKNFKNELIIKRSGIQKQAKNRLLVATDSLFFYSKTDKGRPKGIYEPRNAGWLYFVHYPGVRKSTKERHVFGYTLEPPQGRHWGLKQELIDKWVEKRWVRFRCRNCGYEHYSGKWKGCPHCGSQDFIPELKNPPKRIDSNWTNIQSYSQDPAFPTRNAEDILQRVFETASDKGDLVMDFFLGSGTATAVAQKMQRKWIGVEMGEHFYTYVLPRMKRVLAGEQTGISKEVNWQGGGFFKYCELEQYEDTLNKVEYGETAFQKSSAPELLHSYIFLADHEKLDDLERNKDPLHADLSLLYEDVDLSGSLSCLTGQWIRRITPEKVEFEGGSIVKTDNFEWELIKPFIRW
jgi:adenine-specific DNA-methyltransferase